MTETKASARCTDDIGRNGQPCITRTKVFERGERGDLRMCGRCAGWYDRRKATEPRIKAGICQTCGSGGILDPELHRCVKSEPRVVALCPARLAYRDMSDIGSRRTCGNPAVTPAGFCRRHDPATVPERDKRGRILPSAQPSTVGDAQLEPRIVAECWTCATPNDPGLRTLDLNSDGRTRHRALGHDVRPVEVKP